MPFGSGPHATVLAEALRALLAPVVLVAAIASLLLGLQRNYVGIVTTMRALNLRRRAGEPAARRQFLLVYETASLHARAIAALYGASILLLLCACSTGAAMLLQRQAAPPLLAAAISWFRLICFVDGICLPLHALFLLLRSVGLPLRSVEEVGRDEG